jgi:hypothetical protein
MAQNGKQNTTTGGSADGSAPVHGLAEFQAAGGGTRTPRQPRRGDQTAGITTDPTRSPDMDMVNNAARMGQSLVNSGASDSDGAGPVSDPGGLLSHGGGRPSGATSSDPSSLQAQR